jgi:hypothetical protein
MAVRCFGSGGSPSVGENSQYNDQRFMHKYLNPGTVLAIDAGVCYDVYSKPCSKENGPIQRLFLGETPDTRVFTLCPQTSSLSGQLDANNANFLCGEIVSVVPLLQPLYCSIFLNFCAHKQQRLLGSL